MFSLQSGRIFFYFRRTESWGESKKDSKGDVDINPFAPGDFAEKRVLKLVEWFSGYCRAIKS